ncbi:putative pectinesterase/pectinesterase inhibitor 17 [Acorus calamus]|uniref:Pectinesterase/pectinesterase inhibitor 17 n=1 Tax=Acorus calamus TaxID=4465 RepID=A0AAV9DLW5_ACOCL|nr:putative pectinesterase/pectinesterase inhibitor 17 [Acorus calamus]
MALQATVDRAKQAHQLALAVDLNSLDALTKAAWIDCLELSESTLNHLNHIVGSTANTINTEDIQTWLSAALANQQTCKNGFIEMGLEWVRLSDRKLLQTSSSAASQADIVVAQDGSGNYKTISEAIAAASTVRSGTNRFVIHVKSGVYSENANIPQSMINLMLVGDGIDATAVTGSRSVIDGSTTFASATFAASHLKPVQALFKTYLGRPRQQYSRTVFMTTELDSLIDPAGWLEWSGNFALSTLYYGEYMNTGAGASTTIRVRWPGFHTSMS